jgi:hypothetical protein
MDDHAGEGRAMSLTSQLSQVDPRSVVKPIKFLVSVTLLLGSMALIMPLLTVSEGVRRALAWTLGVTMAIELAAIIVQTARGVPSHFNTRTAFDAAVWQVMMWMIIIALGVLVVCAALATARPLACDPLLAIAIRVGLWLLLLVAVSGFAMGGRGQHAVGGVDHEAWSRSYGDLRVPHFFALHGLQALPIVALLINAAPAGDRVRWLVVSTACVVWVSVSVFTLVQALQGRPLRS